jgi:hypothetical protein
MYGHALWFLMGQKITKKDDTNSQALQFAASFWAALTCLANRPGEWWLPQGIECGKRILIHYPNFPEKYPHLRP